MGIDEGDFFAIRWVAKRETSLDFHCEICVEAYENSFFPSDANVILALGTLKSRIEMEASNGSTRYNESSWQEAIVQGIHSMQDLLLMILKGMSISDDSALDAVIEMTEELEERDYSLTIDPRLN